MGGSALEKNENGFVGAIAVNGFWLGSPLLPTELHFGASKVPSPVLVAAKCSELVAPSMPAVVTEGGKLAAG